MKRIIYSLGSILLLTPITALSMTVAPSQSESLEDTIKKAFAQKVAEIERKKKELYFRAPTQPNSENKPHVSSYTPSTDQEWEIVVVD
ncbi:MAG: hypothetical protein ACHQVS_00090 [Candidatus Babeliales bacterium]